MERKPSIEAVEYVRESIVVPHNESTKLTIWQTVKENPKVIGAAVAMTIGPVVYGFDSIIISLVTAMPSFQNSFGSDFNGVLILPALWLSLWAALLQAGAVLGAVINGPIADRLGRKVSLFIGGFVAAIGVAVVYVSDRADSLEARRSVFLVGRIILGIALGMLNSTYLTYIYEIAPPRIRHPLLSIFTFFLVFGQVIALAIVVTELGTFYASAYESCFAAQWAFAGVATVVGVFIPESPVSLVKRGKIEQAEKSYAQLHNKEEAPIAIEAIRKTIEAEGRIGDALGLSAMPTSFSNLWESLFTETRLIYFLELGGLSAKNSVTVLQWGIGLGLLANVISWVSMSYVGRRTMILASTTGCGLLWLVVGISGCFTSGSALWCVGITMQIIYFCMSVGVSGVSPVVGAETSSVKLRAKSQSVGYACNSLFSWIFNFTVPYMFDADAEDLGGKCGFIFFVLSAIDFVVLFLELPEMKNRTYAELDELFERRVPIRKFAKYVLHATDNNGAREQEKTNLA